VLDAVAGRQQLLADVLSGEVVGGVVGDLPHETGAERVDHHLAAEKGPHPLGARLDAYTGVPFSHPHYSSTGVAMDAGVRTPEAEPATPRWRRRRRRRWQWWSDLHRRLAAHPCFAACSRDEIRRITRWGDEVEVDAGEVLLREDTIGRWLLVILSGEVAVTRRGRAVATLGPGDHVGEVAVLGFGPEAATVRAVTDSRLFVIGRGPLISRACVLTGVQHGLFPGVDAAGFRDHVRQLRADAAEAWRRLPPPLRERAAEPPGPLRWTRRRQDAAAATDESFSQMAGAILRGGVFPAWAEPVRRVPAAAVALAAAGTLAALLGPAWFLWHPPVAVVTPAKALDVSGDMTVTGTTTYPVHGHYLMTPVHTQRPTLGGLVVAWAQGRHTVPVGDDDRAGREAARRQGRQAFADSHVHAVAAVLADLGLDPARVHVEFRSRPLQGPSAGLVYALALADLLTADDLARGRTIAATGQLTDTGGVVPVAFVGEKVSVARAGGAVMFLVPGGQYSGDDGMESRETASLQEALDVLSAR
jgi:antitoxin (DNA-binding transcriptional repressor) of toxin-antitoxin stability system